MIRKKILTLFCLLFITTILGHKTFGQSKAVVIKDFTGDADYRSVKSKSWIPLVGGISISEQNFIRLNSPDSILTMSFPDGSLLRLIGVGSIYIDYISKNENSTTQHKLLLISGRWFYSSTLTNQNRFIMNTDITTSVIENGSGGGYIFNGTNEFLIRTGRGIVSYRQKDSLALVLDERQFVSFNIFDGFDYPKLATAKKFAEYIILLDDTKSDALKSSEPKVLLQNMNQSELSLMERDEFDTKMARRPKKSLSLDEINQNQLDLLAHFIFKTNNINKLQIELATSSVAPKQIEEKSRLVEKPKINPALLKGLDLTDFTIGSNSTDVNKRKKRSSSTNTNQSAQRTITRTKASAVRADVPQQKRSQKNTKNNQESVEEETLDVNDLLNSLSEKARQEQENRRKQNNTSNKGRKAKLVTESITNRTDITTPETTTKAKPVVQTRKIIKKKPAPKKIPAENKMMEEVINEEYLNENEIIEQEPEQIFQQTRYESGNVEHDPRDFEYNPFSVESAEDLLNGEFSRVLFDI
ncbi:MAG: hypothetical protein ACRCV0_01520 [Brevinema sp.]